MKLVMKKIVGWLLGGFVVLFGGTWLYCHLMFSSTVPVTPITHPSNELDQIQTQLNLLTQTNQKKIEEAQQIQTLDDQLNKQISSHIGLIQDLYQAIGQLEKEASTKEEQLKTATEEAEKKTLTQEIQNLQQNITTKKEEKTQLEQATQALVEQRKALNQRQTTLHQTINQENKVINQTQQFQVLYTEIEDLKTAMRENEVNQQRTAELLKEQPAHSTETPQLEKYQLFLRKQLLAFNQKIQKINQMIEILKNPQLVTDKKKPKTFQNVYGMEKEKNRLAKLVHYFKADKHVLGYQNVRPMGVLLYGPPGTGKSHLIEAFCGETETHFIELDPSRFDKTYVGEGNEELEKIWAEAESHDKAVIFIDEISGLANREDKNTNQTASNIVNNLLTKIDGFKRSNKKILLMGATNHLEKIDSALRSRFQQEIEIDSFSKEEIPGFLEFLILQNNYRLSYHTFNYIMTLVNRLPKDKSLSNRDWVKLLNDAFLNYDYYAYHFPRHEVMLPSDLDEALETQINQLKTQAEEQQRREACEAEYAKWKEGLLKYFTDQRDMTPVQKTYIFQRFNGLDQCQHPDLVAQSLTPLMKGPFDNWLLDSNDPFITREEFELFKDLFENVYYFSTIRESTKSDFDSNILVSIDYLLHQIRFDYEGPKYLLEEDKDFYIGILKFFIQKKIRGERKEISYFLHFNPVKQYITLYTKPMNAKENPTYDNLFLYLQRK
ncbi:AAA family ATPase [Candidatus Phytoplasma phoenicium]|uniref:AAA+ ATPase n=1 Tax=Candidatus Phytoplasma phoenicium TaxID=198422 RepID=A0A0L0MJ99_9MOLU|nr:AAA family ATPase [Candidatus Phytoplasma phoenicium]KND62722.1 AAA+ ATPase [Candidatus Phytoplasma phoenicium]